MTGASQAENRPVPERDNETGLTDAPAEIGNTSDLADGERLADERARRWVSDRPDLPDRAFDHITPQV